jgi:hypothetical protein
LDRTVLKARLRVKEACSGVPAKTSNVLPEIAVGANPISR